MSTLSKFVISCYASNVEKPPLVYREAGGKFKWLEIRRQHEFFAGHEGIHIQRLDRDANCYLMNCGPVVLHITYASIIDSFGNRVTVVADQETPHTADYLQQVGPRWDFLMPGQFREIGAGPGVIWEIKPLFYA